jgi:hypothetical protein
MQEFSYGLQKQVINNIVKQNHEGVAKTMEV